MELLEQYAFKLLFHHWPDQTNRYKYNLCPALYILTTVNLQKINE